jgi:hypothetical protein
LTGTEPERPRRPIRTSLRNPSGTSDGSSALRGAGFRRAPQSPQSTGTS